MTSPRRTPSATEPDVDRLVARGVSAFSAEESDSFEQLDRTLEMLAHVLPILRRLKETCGDCREGELHVGRILNRIL